jgi:starch synthase
VNVLFATVEMSPLAKVGGLGDVAGSLPRALRSRGADVRVLMPLHGVIRRESLALERVADGIEVPWYDGPQHVALWRADVRDVPVYLVGNERYFDRPEVYGYDDDNDRMLFACEAMMAAGEHLGFQPDVVHAQDWHTGFLLLRLAQAQPSCADGGPGLVYTIHNLGLQGNFDRKFALRHGLADVLEPPPGLPKDIMFSAMAQGIAGADRVNTVSDTYAKEILTPAYGAGLDPLLQARSDVLSGIVNGIDYEEFDPERDQALARTFSIDTLDARIENKRALQERAGLPVRDDALLFASVTRLWEQKGIDLVAVAFDSMLGVRDTQLIVLGTGDEAVHRMLLQLQDRFPDKVKVWIDFNPPLGQLVYGACDCFLMPSRYEPCGLNQIYSLRYGTVPVVRATGGLDDTIQPFDALTGRGTGFKFEAYDGAALAAAVKESLKVYRDQKSWRKLMLNGMAQDFSWKASAAEYVKLYEQARKTRIPRAAGHI